MAEILHQLIGSLSHYLQGFIHPWWCRISLHQQYGSVCGIYATTVFRVKYMTKRAPFSGRMYTARKTPKSRNYRSQKFHMWSFKTFWMFCLDFVMAMLGLTWSDYLHKHPAPGPNAGLVACRFKIWVPPTWFFSLNGKVEYAHHQWDHWMIHILLKHPTMKPYDGFFWFIDSCVIWLVVREQWSMISDREYGSYTYVETSHPRIHPRAVALDSSRRMIAKVEMPPPPSVNHAFG